MALERDRQMKFRKPLIDYIDTEGYDSHYAFIRFGLGEPPRDALWMAAFARRDGLPIPGTREQAYIAQRWEDR